ncbi:EP300-interacting inhibitor of differentiation 3 [Centruroides vittatus]|uniref:EP300-interacting inhibitor of differentiation 3 n=1 Tax=Centruroides vittatus TaxID=120091 RepID=UPI00350F33AF
MSRSKRDNESDCEDESWTDDERERRSIRHKYREMINDTKRQREEITHSKSDLLSERLNEANLLFKKVKKTREAAMDSRLIYLCAAAGKQQAQALHTDFLTFQPLEFAEKLISYLRPNRIDTDEGGGSEQPCPLLSEHWIEFGKQFHPLINKSPSFHYIYGSFEIGDVQAKGKRKPMKKKDKDAPTKAITPTTVNSLGSNNETTTEEVEEILKLLQKLYVKNKHEPICYFEFVTDPESFSHTVENMFHVSFLVKDGVVKIYLDDDNLPVIEPILQQNKESTGSSRGKQHQIIMSVTIQEWKNIVETFQIERAIITRRKRS